jgi:hypothetical protein
MTGLVTSVVLTGLATLGSALRNPSPDPPALAVSPGTVFGEVAVPGSAQAVGPPPSAVQHVLLTIALACHHPESLDRPLERLQDPGPSGSHQYLSASAIQPLFGPSSA